MRLTERMTEVMELEEYRERGEPQASQALFPAASREGCCGSLDFGVSFDWELAAANIFL